GSIKSRMLANGSPLPERSARRNATVTSSVPLAISASRISSFDANFPVPTSKREVNSRSAIFSFEGLSAIAKKINEFAQTRECRSGERRYSVEAGVPPASPSDLQPTQLPLQASVSRADRRHFCGCTKQLITPHFRR